MALFGFSRREIGDAKRRGKKNAAPSARRLALEALETRELLSVENAAVANVGVALASDDAALCELRAPYDDAGIDADALALAPLAALGDEASDPASDGDGVVNLETPTGSAFVIASFGLVPTSQPIQYTWNSISKAKSYTVRYKATNESTWSTVGVQSTETSYKFGSELLTPGATYEFQVRANGDGGVTTNSSPFSTSVSKLFVGKFSQPTISVSGATSSSTTVKWGAIKGAKSYTLQYKLSNATNWTSVAIDSTKTSHTVSGLTKNVKYDFCLQADGDGATCYSSDFSAVVSYTPVEAPTLRAPKLEFVGSTSTSVALKWNAISGAKSYTLQYKLSSASSWTSQGIKATETTFTVAGLTKNKEYEFRIRANGDGGATAKSSGFSAVVAATARATLATPELATSATKTSITAYWDAIPNAKSYTIQYKLSTDSDAAWKSVGAQGTATSATIVGLKAGNTYQVRIRANGDGGATWYSSEFSAPISVKTQPKLARATLALAGSTNDSITVKWDAISGAKSYTLQYKLASADDSAWTNKGVRATETSCAVSGLTKGKTYEFRLRANGDGGATYLSSDFSAALTATVENRTLATPTLKVASKTDSSVSLSWNAIANAKSYVLQYKLSTSSAWSAGISLASSKTTHTISGLKASTKYDFQIRAVGNGSTSFDSNYGATSGTTATAAKQLAAPTPSIGAVTANSIAISWKAISGAKSYSIEYKLSTTSSWTTKSATGTSATLTGLTRGSKYQIRMRAIGDGVSYKTSSYSGTLTQIAAPKLASPTLKNVGSTNNSIDVGWQKVSGAKSYTIQYKLSTASEWTTKSAAATATSATISGLTKGKTYEFQIRANGDGGATYLSSDFSAKLTATAELKLAAPQLVATMKDAGLEISWRAISGAASYTLQYRTSGATTWTNKGVRATETSVVFDNLASGAVYEFRMRANGDGGATCKSSEFGDVLSARFIGRLASPTTNVLATAYDAATISWSSVAGATSYTLQYKRADASAWTSLSVGASYASCALSGFSAGLWQFRIRANGDGGSTSRTSEFSETQTIYLGALCPAPDPIDPPDALFDAFDPELDELLTALAENWD